MRPFARHLFSWVPAGLRARMRDAGGRLQIAAARRGTSFHCISCGSSIGRFMPFKLGTATLSPFLQRASYRTGDLDHHACPVCWSGDRERHLIFYLDALGTWDVVRGGRVLHFAPERALRDRILGLGPARYVAADLNPTEDGTVAMDVTAIDEPDASFDLVLCNHVLEHVPDLRAALAEIHRVLAPGGTAVLQTPFAAGLGMTFQDPLITSDEDRLFFYGQEDHVRLFGLDLFERIEEAHLRVERIAHRDVLATIDARTEGLSPDEDLILATKPCEVASRDTVPSN